RDQGGVLGDSAVRVADLALDGPAAVVVRRAAGGARGTEGAVPGATAAVEGIAEAGGRVRGARIVGTGQREADRASLVDRGRAVEGRRRRDVADGDGGGTRRRSRARGGDLDANDPR